MEVPNAATKKELKEVTVDTEKEYSVSESMGCAQLKPLLIFSLPMEESDPYSFISFVNQSLMMALDSIKKWDGFS